MTTVVVQTQFSETWWVFLYDLASTPINPSINLEFDVSNVCSFCLRTCQQITTQTRNRMFHFRFVLFFRHAAHHNSEHKSDTLGVFFLLLSDMSADHTSEQLSNVSSVLFLHVDMSAHDKSEQKSNVSSVFACEYGYVSRLKSEYDSFVLWVFGSPDYHATIVAVQFSMISLFPSGSRNL